MVWRAITAVSLVAVLAACGADPDIVTPGAPRAAALGAPVVARVALRDLGFVPPRVTVAVGSTVVWTWDDGVIAHDVAGPGFHSPAQATGSFRHRFTNAGTYEVRCLLHPSMRSTVVVR